MLNAKLNKLKEVSAELDNILSAINDYNTENFPNGKSEEAQTLEEIYIGIRKQKDELENFVDEQLLKSIME